MDIDNDWWLTATTPEGVNLYRFGYDDADTAEERSAAIGRVRESLGFPGDEVLIDPGNPWSLSFAPGRPDRFFDRATDEPLPGVTVHEGAA